MKLNQKGQMLVEAMVAVALFAVLAAAAVGMMYSGATSSKQGADYVVAAGVLQEGIEGVRSIRYRNFSEIINGTHGLDTVSGYYEFSGTSNALFGGDYTRTITVEDVLRDGSDDIALAGAVDADTKKITVNVVWDTLSGKTQNIDAVYFVHNFDFFETWVQTLLADFQAGSLNSTTAQAAGNGEVVMRGMRSDWSNLDHFYTSDLAGNGDGIAVTKDTAQDLVFTLTATTAGDELAAFDVSDVSESIPTKIDGYDVTANPTDLAVSNGYTYVSTDGDSEEVAVVRISDMTNVESIDLPGGADAYSVATTGTQLLIGRNTSSDKEFYVYDVATPEGAVSELGSTELGFDCSVVATDGSYAYCGSTNDSSEIIVIRLSNFTQVNTVNLTGGGNVDSLLRSGTSLYVGRVNGGTDPDFLELNIATPEGTISVLNSLDTDSSVTGIEINENDSFAFLSTNDNSQELSVIDLSSFTETQAGDTTSGSDASGIVQIGAHIYVLTGNDSEEFNVFRTDEGGWGSPSLVGSVDKSGNQDGAVLTVSGNFAYLGTVTNSGAAEFFIYDIATPSNPTLLGSFETGAGIADIAVSGNYAYLASSDNSRELDVIDITTKTAPARAGSYNMSGNADATSVELSGSTVYLGRVTNSGSGNHEFWIVNASTPSAPTLTGSMDYASTINDIALDGTAVYAATASNSAELLVINISTPSSPTTLTSLNLANNDDGLSLALSGDTLALGRSSGAGNELQVVDVTTPSAPTAVGGGEVGSNVNAVALDGASVAFLGVDLASNEFQRWDISTPATPVQESTYSLGDDGKRLSFDGTYVHIATDNDGLEYQIIGPLSAPSDYPLASTFTSQAFDSTSAATTWGDISWTTSGTGTVVFRIRTASTEAGLATEKWVGSDGTRDTTYSTSETAIVTDPGASGGRWVQWKAYLTGSGSATPVVEDVSITYEP